MKTGFAGQSLIAEAAANELYKAALAEGLGHADFAAASRVIRP